MGRRSERLPLFYSKILPKLRSGEKKGKGLELSFEERKALLEGGEGLGAQEGLLPPFAVVADKSP